MPTKAKPLATIHVFNVGQGDTIAVELTAGDRLVVIDCNARSRSNPNGPAGLIGLLNKRSGGGRPDIDLLCLSHPDWDHARGMYEVVEHVLKQGGEIRHFLTTGFTWKQIEADFLKRTGQVPIPVVNGARFWQKLDTLIEKIGRAHV